MTRRSTRYGLFLTFAAASLFTVLTLYAQRNEPAGEWRFYAGSPYSLKYSPLDQITKNNVKDLEIAWKWSSVELDVQKSDPRFRIVRNENTPLMANGVVYTVTGLGLVAAIDAGTGQTKWSHDPQAYKPGRPNNGGFLSRTFGYWTDGKVERVLTGTHDGYLLSLDARTGKPDPAFGTDGRVDGNVGIRDVVRSTNLSLRGPFIAGNIAVVGSSISDQFRDAKRHPPGYVNAFDVRTGKHLWTFHTVPKADEFGYDTWLNGSAEYGGGNNVWGGMAFDPELDYLYLATSTPTGDYYGVDRPGDNLFAESIICVEARTGKRVWHFQAIHHGVWDYDFPTHPVLGEITVNGRRIRAVIQVSKQAFTYAFDRRTGQPVWPIEERPVPQSAVAGERTSPTQPFPTKPPPFDVQGSHEANVMDFTPELRKRALEQMKPFVTGPLYTPPAEQGTVVVPGTLGGANWGGAAFDPETGILYVPSRTTAQVIAARPRSAEESASTGPAGGQGAQADAAPVRSSGPNLGLSSRLVLDGLPLFKPPYARLTAIDMNRGEILWTSAIGNGPRDHPALKGLNLPPLGDQVDGVGVLAMKDLVFASAWKVQRANGQAIVPTWQPYGDPAASRKVLYAFDKRTGALLREFEMEENNAAPPMTYMHQGKQYLVMAVGANEKAAIVAYSLPGNRR
jgi:quinoprotein glucose dehydrogenase